MGDRAVQAPTDQKVAWCHGRGDGGLDFPPGAIASLGVRDVLWLDFGVASVEPRQVSLQGPPLGMHLGMNSGLVEATRVIFERSRVAQRWLS